MTSPTEVVPLTGAVRPYAWGSRTAIQQLLGRQPDGQPIAELWFGAHPDDPSPTADTTLDALIARNPPELLGPAAVERFGPRLPYLLKILAADSALSMQVHPTLAQARAGFARENAAGLGNDSPERNYRDSNHKPELLCALTPFEAVCGFRPIAGTLALLDELDLPELAFVGDALRDRDPLRAAFTALLTHPDPAPLVAALARRSAAATAGPLHGARLAIEDFPGDIGAVLTLLLNHVVLAPGEAIYLAAGVVHAYLRGTGVEIMANSDNVLRCGLTPKHVDVEELLKITDFTELADPMLSPVGTRFEVPVDDFALTRLPLDQPVGLHDAGPCIVLCTEGAVAIGGVSLSPGRAALVPADLPVTIGGAGLVFVASVGARD